MERRDFELGRDVTAHAKADGKRETVVLSVRVTGEELRRLEILARNSGRSVSQLVREALNAYTPAASGTQATSVLSIGFPFIEATTHFGSHSQATGLSVPTSAR